MQCLSAGEDHTAVVRSDGALFTCGSNICGQLGHGGDQDNQDTDVLTHVQGALLGKRVVAASAGEYYTAAITDAGELFTWGSGRHGRLGHGDVEDRHVPTQVQGELSGKRVVEVSGGGYHTAAVTEVGELYVWGSGDACGVDEDVRTPIRVGGALLGEQVVAVSAGAFHTAVLTAAGAVYTFGCGGEGQLGHGDRNSRKVPTLVGGALQGRVVVAVSAGVMTTAVVMQSGELYTFGKRFDYGEDGSTVPMLVVAPLGKHCASVSTAGYHMVATTVDGAC
jgi:alpha-tubulin suppressor-like RCC1 family protein